jgi:hypothetical protein
MNFAYVYTLCHKEGHTAAARTGLWHAPYDKRGIFRYIFNWWIGLFYGVLPASFAIGHSVNHHRYNNGPGDVISTSDKPRDSFTALICYLPRFMLYATNVSTVWQFLQEGQHKVAKNAIFGSIYYLLWVVFVAISVGPAFVIGYVLFHLYHRCATL